MARQLPANACSAAEHASVDISGQRHQKVRVIVRHVFSLETLAVVFGNKAGVEVARHKLGVRQQSGLERNIAADAADHKGVERFSHLGDSFEPVPAVHDELGDHRVVVHRNLAAVLHAGVYAHTLQLSRIRSKHGFLRRLKTHQPAS